MIGRTFGHYEVLEKIGRGGMGEVYRARDTRLDRPVALKFLPEETASDPDRIRRFEREARAVAALKHPNIVTVYSVEEIEGRTCLAMELIEGKTFSELIPKDGLSLDRFFELSIPLADALSAAHAKGITHRDLKPSNIMVDSDGRLKVLDFGLAKLLAPEDIGEDETVIDDEVTAEGKVLGTVYYMSPEQAEAKSLDHRSDIFSMGIVLYEMATGRRPFSGDTPISTISAILKEKPPSVTDLRGNLPRHLARVINRCIEKNPDKRFQTARDVCNELEGLQKEVESGDIEQVSTGSMSVSDLDIARLKRRNPWPIVAGVAVVAVAVLGYFAFFRGKQSEPAREISTRPMTSMVGTELPGSWSPDGGFFAYEHSQSGPLDIFIVSSAGGDPIKLVESPYDDGSARWSPDNRWIAFASGRDHKTGIYLVPPLGGQIQALVETGLHPLSGLMYASLGATPWSPDGRTLVFMRRGEDHKIAIWKIDLESRQETRLTVPATGESDFSASFSFEGDRILFCRSNGTTSRLMVMPASGGEPAKILSEDEQYLSPAWAPGGNEVVYSKEDGGLWKVDLRSGKTRQLTTGGTEGAPVVSRSGQILFATFSHQTDIYVQDLDGKNEERLTFHTLDNFGPQISHDGSKVVYMSSRTGNAEIWLLDRSSGAERQLTNRDADDWGPSWSRDDRNIVFGSDYGGNRGIWIVSVDGGALSKLGDHEITDGDPKWSPDGLAIGFISDSDGEEALYVVAPEGGTSRKILDNVSSFEWYLDSRRVVYRSGGAVSNQQMRAADLETGEQVVLLEGAFSEHSVAPDGQSVSYVSAMSHYNMNLHVLMLKKPTNGGGLPQPIGPPVTITHGDGKWHVHNGGWSPDSKQVIYTRDTDTGDIYLLEGGL